MSILYCQGDSITAGAQATTAAERYTNRLAASLDATLVNKGVSTFMAIDGSDALMSVSLGPDDYATVMFGTNDQAKYDADPVKRSFFIDALRAYIVRMSCVPKAISPANGASFTGAWNNTFAYSCYGATATGAKVSFQANGDAIAIGFLRQYSNGGRFSVTIDGVPKGEFSIGGDVRTILGKAFGVASVVLSGLGAGSHTVVIEALAANATTNVVFIHWFAELSSSRTKVAVGNVPHALAYTYGGSHANVDAYNADILSLVSGLQALGVDVEYVDVCSVLLPSDMADNPHPNSSGHLKVANAFLAAFGVTKTYVPAEIVLGSDGKFYAKSGSVMVQITA